MATDSGLAKIERVDLREAWPNETADFTPWLAENISELGGALGMDLELQSQEAPVGGFSLDVLASDLGSGGLVVIENQLELTDHDQRKSSVQGWISWRSNVGTARRSAVAQSKNELSRR